MNIEPPGLLDWLVLALIALVGGAANALRTYARAKKSVRIVLSIAELMTFCLVMFTSFMVLRWALPSLFGWQVQDSVVSALAGWTAHIGIRNTILMLMRLQGAFVDSIKDADRKPHP